MWRFAVLWCYVEGVITVKVAVATSTSTIGNKSSVLLHLVGFLSSRFTHDARSQEHKSVVNISYRSITLNSVSIGQQHGHSYFRTDVIKSVRDLRIIFFRP